jgi:hypothetical protein
MMPNAPAIARIGTDPSGFGESIPVGTTPEAFNHPSTRPAKPTEHLHIKIGQGGLVDYETEDGPATELPSGVKPPQPPHGTINPPAPKPSLPGGEA